MKYITPALALIAIVAAGIVLTSSKTVQAVEEVPRYHMFYPNSSTEIFLYDAVTGEIKMTYYRDLKSGKTIKELMGH